MAQAFDAAALRTTGEPSAIAEQVDYVSGNIQGQMTWLNRSGRPA
jgi:hypothetical protein